MSKIAFAFFLALAAFAGSFAGQAQAGQSDGIANYKSPWLYDRTP